MSRGVDHQPQPVVGMIDNASKARGFRRECGKPHTIPRPHRQIASEFKTEVLINAQKSTIRASTDRMSLAGKQIIGYELVH